ncbi:hypothetical protein ACHQM5_021123 [Ranunculus cassubicifolius]
METSNSNEEEIPLSLDRPSRKTRGKRMTKLLDEELEEDELFWNQEALKEEEHDINYEADGDGADVFDSDFDEDEPEPDGEAENDGEERERKKKRLLPPGKPVVKKKHKKKVLSKLGKSSKDEVSSPAQESSPPEHHDTQDDLEGERTVRKSTRTSVIVRQAEREAIRAAVQATMKHPVRRKKEGEERRMTQEEMLLEAAQTEIVNLRNLERVLAREEEVKKRAVVHKMVYSGPQVRYSSKDGQNLLEFSKGFSFGTEICTTRPPYPQKAVCAITGLPAKYRDPKTGLPYATKEAFKLIRQRFSMENSKLNKEKKNIGILLDSISGQGFLGKRKRSQAVKRRETTYHRNWARFRVIPALESEEED